MSVRTGTWDGGRAYFINDQDKQTFREFIGMIASLQDLSIDKLRSMPYRLAFLMGRMMETVWSMRRHAGDGDPPLSRSMVRMIGREFRTSDAASRRELGYVGKTTLADGLRLYQVAARHPPEHQEHGIV